MSSSPPSQQQGIGFDDSSDVPLSNFASSSSSSDPDSSRLTTLTFNTSSLTFTSARDMTLEDEDDVFSASSPSPDPLGPSPASPLAPKKETGQNTFQASVNIMKCIIGAGSFFLPYGLKQGGLWGGLIGLVLLGFVCDYINIRIIQCKRKVFPNQPCSYADLAQATFGKAAGMFTYVFMLIQGLGACAVYVVFCGDLLHAVSSKLSVAEYIIIIGAFEILLSWIKSFRYLSVTSILGDLSLLLGVVVVFAYGFKDGGFIDSPFDFPAFRPSTYPQFFGTAAFLFSITMYLFPIESSMKEPRFFPLALHSAFFITTILNVVFAGFGYMFFGDDVKDIVIDNLGTKSAFIIVAKVALVFDLIFTFVVVFVPCRDVVETSLLENILAKWRLKRRARNEGEEEKQILWQQKEDEAMDEDEETMAKKKKELQMEVPYWWRMLMRTFMIVVTVGFAVALPNVSDLVGLIVGVSNSMNSFILPMVIYLKLSFNERQAKRRLDQQHSFLDIQQRQTRPNWPQVLRAELKPSIMWHYFAHSLIILFGLVAGVATTVQAIQKCIKDFS
ncbi:Transmembrane amino acid transporter protein [Balamuthia mandrillaris]